MQPTPGIRIEPAQLTAEALRGVIEEFVTRDGTELSEAGVKVLQVERLLARGEAEIWFDRTSGTCSIAAPRS